MEYLYRFSDYRVSNGVDEYERSLGGGVKVRLDRFCITKKTPKGVWIDAWGEDKFVNLTAVKQYACVSVESAKQSYLARKKRQISILSSRLRLAESALSLAKLDCYITCFADS